MTLFWVGFLVGLFYALYKTGLLEEIVDKVFEWLDDNYRECCGE
jgi:hypothetical protein